MYIYIYVYMYICIYIYIYINIYIYIYICTNLKETYTHVPEIIYILYDIVKLHHPRIS